MTSKRETENYSNVPGVSGFANVRIKTEYPEPIHNNSINNNAACMINVLHGFHPEFEHPPNNINNVMPIAMYHHFQNRDVLRNYTFKTELFNTEEEESNSQSILEIGAIPKPSSSSARHMYNGNSLRSNETVAHMNPLEGNSRAIEVVDEGMMEFRSNCQPFNKPVGQSSNKSQGNVSNSMETHESEPGQSSDGTSNDSHNESSQLHIHIVQTKRFRCRYCSKVFSGKSSRRDHELMHTGGKKYLCNFCEETFKDVQSKQDHERTHAAENMFSCHFCDKAFSDANDKEAHERTHVGDKPYSCRYCHKSFANRFIKNNHEFVHTGEKPFVCKYCGKAFSWRSSVITHERIHTGTRPFPCSYCKKAFHQRVQRDIHQRTHTGEKPFSCQYCGHRFSQNHYRIVHEQRNHVLENAIATANAGDHLMQKLDNVNSTE